MIYTGPTQPPKQNRGSNKEERSPEERRRPYTCLSSYRRLRGIGAEVLRTAPHPLSSLRRQATGAPSFPHAFLTGNRHKKTPRTRYARSSRAMLRPIKTRVLVRKASGGAAYTWYVSLPTRSGLRDEPRRTQRTRFRTYKAGSDAQGAQVRCVLDVRERLWNAAHQVPQLTTRR